MTLESAVGYLTASSCLLSICCVIFHAIAFGTRVWLKGDGISPFRNLGFHEACFDKCHEPWCPGGDESVIFDGCWWVHDFHFRSIWWWLIPDWFLDIRNLAIGVIPLSVMCLVMLCISMGLAAAASYTATPSRTKNLTLVITLFVTAAFLLVTGCLCIVILGQFYMNSYRRDWMPMPERNSFGYSYWLEMTTAAMLMAAFLMTTLAGIFKLLDMSQDKASPYAEDMMLGRH